MASSAKTTIDQDEVEKFSAIAAEWWDPSGKFKPLHKFNPVRLKHIRKEICDHFGLDHSGMRPFKGLRILDIGCGGGLISEPLTRLGAQMTSIDAAERNVKTALTHAAEQNLEIDYRATTIEELCETEIAPFDVVLNLEVVEHVADVDLFLSKSASLVRPGGLMMVATINKTLKALLTAKIGAEYILRWLPAGTHDPKKFVRPEKIRSVLQTEGLTLEKPVGMSYLPLLDQWRITDDASINYMMTAHKPS